MRGSIKDILKAAGLQRCLPACLPACGSQLSCSGSAPPRPGPMHSSFANVARSSLLSSSCLPSSINVRRSPRPPPAPTSKKTHSPVLLATRRPSPTSQKAYQRPLPPFCHQVFAQGSLLHTSSSSPVIAPYFAPVDAPTLPIPSTHHPRSTRSKKEWPRRH